MVQCRGIINAYCRLNWTITNYYKKGTMKLQVFNYLFLSYIDFFEFGEIALRGFEQILNPGFLQIFNMTPLRDKSGVPPIQIMNCAKKQNSLSSKTKISFLGGGADLPHPGGLWG